ncbi:MULTISPECIES: hypothetical protein [Burkholderia]|uniref:hypothetical protein n=1 Tax=Burkholderia TaxID=32008 RepID=UPI000AC895B1|nr:MULTISPECIES: hypothetical protein [unclassified Burkholderia]
MPTTPPINPSPNTITLSSDDTQRSSPSALSFQSPRVTTTSLTSSSRLSSYSRSSQQQGATTSNHRTVSPLSEINFEIALPFSNLNPNEQDDFIREIINEGYSEQENQPLTSVTPMSVDTIQNWLTSDFPYQEQATIPPIQDRVELNSQVEETANIEQTSAASASTAQETSARRQFGRRSIASAHPPPKVTAEILRLAHEKIGIGPGKIARHFFEKKYNLPSGTLQFHINVDGTLTERAQRFLANPTRTNTITAEALQKAASMVQDSNKCISNIATEIGVKPKQLYPYLTKSGLSLAGKQALARCSGENVFQTLTTDLIQLGTQRIGKAFDKISLSEFCRNHSLSLALLRKYIKADGSLTAAGKNKLDTEKNKNQEIFKSQKSAIKTAALKIAKSDRWNFPFADLIFLHSLKFLTNTLNIKLDIVDLEKSHSIGNSSSPHIGKLFFKKNNHIFQIENQCYIPPQDGDSIFHALNAMRIYNNQGNFGDYIINPPDQNGTLSLNLPSNDASIKSEVNDLRYKAATYVMRNADEIAQSVLNQQPREAVSAPSPAEFAPSRINANAGQAVCLPESSSASPHSYSSSTPMEESLSMDSHQPPDIIATGKNPGHGKKRVITPQLLKLAQRTIVGNPKKIPSFLKEHGIKIDTLRLYISSHGLTLAGQQVLAADKDEKALKPLTVEMLQLASQSIGTKPGDMNRDEFARRNKISTTILKYYLKADGTLSNQGKSRYRRWLPLFQNNQPAANSIANRRRAVREAALKLKNPGEWNFPHSDQLFSYFFSNFASDHNIRFGIQTPDYSQYIGNPNASYAGTLILKQNHYNVQINENCYDVPADGDCAFHALNVLRLHSSNQELGDYIVGPRRPDGIIPLSIPADDTTIKQAIGGTRYMAAEHAMRHIDELAEAIDGV